MNNKRFACGLIFSTLLLTACVKKEAPTEDTNDSQSTDTAAVIVEPTETVEIFEEPAEQNVQEPLIVETVEVEETPHTTTEIRRSTPAAEAPAATTSTPAKTSTSSAPAATSAPAAQLNNNSEEDAIAAAMAAAAPALEN